MLSQSYKTVNLNLLILNTRTLIQSCMVHLGHKNIKIISCANEIICCNHNIISCAHEITFFTIIHKTLTMHCKFSVTGDAVLWLKITIIMFPEISQ